MAYFLAFCSASCWWDVSLGSVNDLLSFLAPGPDNTGPVCAPCPCLLPTMVIKAVNIPIWRDGAAYGHAYSSTAEQYISLKRNVKKQNHPQVINTPSFLIFPTYPVMLGYENTGLG